MDHNLGTRTAIIKDILVAQVTTPTSEARTVNGHSRYLGVEARGI